jgi:hypothetical protein
MRLGVLVALLLLLPIRPAITNRLLPLSEMGSRESRIMSGWVQDLDSLPDLTCCVDPIS